MSFPNLPVCQSNNCVSTDYLSNTSKATVAPTLEVAREVIAKSRNAENPPNLLPLMTSIPAELLTPTLAYLRIAAK